MLFFDSLHVFNENDGDDGITPPRSLPDVGFWPLVFLYCATLEHREIVNLIKLHYTVLQKHCKTKLTYAGHMLRGSSGVNAVLMLEGKIKSVRTWDRPRRNCL